MVERMDWHCPMCGRKYAIPAVSPLPNLCPNCDPQEVHRRVPKLHVSVNGETSRTNTPKNSPHKKATSYLKIILVISVLLMAAYRGLRLFKIEFTFVGNDGPTSTSEEHPATSIDQNKNNEISQSKQRDKNNETSQSTQGDVTSPNQPFERDLGKPKTLIELVKEIEPSVVRVTHESVLGSGFLVQDSQTVITNYHVIAGARSAFVTFPNGESIRVVGTKGVDRERDLAILRLERVSTSKALALAIE